MSKLQNNYIHILQQNRTNQSTLFDQDGLSNQCKKQNLIIEIHFKVAWYLHRFLATCNKQT